MTKVDSGFNLGEYAAAGFKHVINGSVRIPAGLANVAALSYLARVYKL